ncbi:hypothetical protein BGX38DRAFT_1147170 [Terfezia claveryi]|nr:hypothetical protein BGX38DRAFT_1147170 [Terfezia claveryi]
MDVIFRKYFASVKIRGNFDETFFDSINEVFICLVTSAMRHCLKSWTTGVYVEPSKTGNFKYDISISTWNAHPRKVHEWQLHNSRDVWNQTNPSILVIPPPLKLSSPKNFSRPNKQLSLHGNAFLTACGAWLMLKRMKTTSLANSIFDVQDDEHQTSNDEQTENDLDIDE